MTEAQAVGCRCTLTLVTEGLPLFLVEPLGGVKNLEVSDPTTSSLKVRWEPAEGNVRQYRIFYVPASGGAEDMVTFLILLSA